MLGPSWFLQPGATFGVPGPASHALALDVRSDDLTVTPAAASGARPTPARSSEGVESGAATDPILLDRTAPAGMTRITRGEVRPVPFPVMIADIGGTNVRLALLLEAHSPLREFATVQTSDFATFAEAATAVVLDTTAVMPRSLLVALAGPATGPSLRLTNADWVIEPEALRTALNLDTVITFNDFEALALSLPGLRGEQIMAVGGGEPVSRAPRVVLGPATGLGVAALVYGDQCYTPIAGEGGHVSLGPETARDFAIWPRLDRFHGRISAEALLTGDGLARIYRALAAEGRAGRGVVPLRRRRHEPRRRPAGGRGDRPVPDLPRPCRRGPRADLFRPRRRLHRRRDRPAARAPGGPERLPRSVRGQGAAPRDHGSHSDLPRHRAEARRRRDGELRDPAGTLRHRPHGPPLRRLARHLRRAPKGEPRPATTGPGQRNIASEFTLASSRLIVHMPPTQSRSGAGVAQG